MLVFVALQVFAQGGVEVTLGVGGGLGGIRDLRPGVACVGLHFNLGSFLRFAQLRRGAEDQDVLDLLLKLVIVKGTKLDEVAQVLPTGDVLGGVVAVQGLEAIAHLLGNVVGNATDGAIALQEAPAHVERNIGAIDHPAQGQQKAGHHLFRVVGDKHLVAVELNAALGDVDIGLELREVENAVDHKGVVGVEVNPQQRVFLEGIQIAVKLQVVIVGEAAGRLFPGSFVLVDNFAVDLDRHRHEVAVGFNQLPNAGGFRIFLFSLHQGEGNGGAHGAAL